MPQAFLAEWRAAHGQNWRALMDSQTGYVEMLHGGKVTAASNPQSDADFAALADAALADTVALHGIDLDTLTFERAQFLPLGQVGSGDKMTLRYREEVNGVRVVGGAVNVLFSAAGELLSVHSTGLPHLSGFDTMPTVYAYEAATVALARFDELTGVPPTEVRAPELVIDQIRDGAQRIPRLAWLVNVLREGQDEEPVGWRTSIDARTGVVLRAEPSVHFDVSGTVTAMSSPGLRPDKTTNPPVAQPVKYLRVTSSAGTTYTDANGNFNYPGVNTPLAVTFQFTTGQRANVSNQAGANYTLTQTLQPNQANPVLMNSPAVATVTSQANAHRTTAMLGEYIQSINPTDTHASFSAWAKVNINSTCNAYYNGNSINFYAAGGSCVNTAYSTIDWHEFGHWMNDLYGTNNGGDGMGEGNADVWAMYIANDPIVGREFCGATCNVRSGTNTRQFCGDCCGGCYGQVHEDGMVWMGAAWKVRSRLQATNGQVPGGMIADNLFLAWMNSYNQTQIKSIIETQWMTLDDTNGNINDGTPHFNDIDGGFRQQGFPGLVVSCPSPSNYCVTSPNSFDPTGAVMSFSGSNQISNNDFVLLAYGVPPHKTGLFFYGQGQASVPFGNGTRCVASPIFRLPPTTSSDFGDLSTNLDLNALAPNGQISAGETWNFQAFFRDPQAGGAFFNATDGMQVPWCD